jgi:hypothetical protein
MREHMEQPIRKCNHELPVLNLVPILQLLDTAVAVCVTHYSSKTQVGRKINSDYPIMVIGCKVVPPFYLINNTKSVLLV